MFYCVVHDCYWTHACDVVEMNKVCRQEFIALHSYPILENLSQSFKGNIVPYLTIKIYILDSDLVWRMQLLLILG